MYNKNTNYVFKYNCSNWVIIAFYPFKQAAFYCYLNEIKIKIIAAALVIRMHNTSVLCYFLKEWQDFMLFCMAFIHR